MPAKPTTPSRTLPDAGTNINPATGLATDYLNHFNEAIMLLELIVHMPECREDFFAWRPRSYGEHFAASNFKHRDLAVAAYETADPALRERLDALADTANAILMATHQVLRQDVSNPAAIADLALRWIKPLVVRAGGVINGTGVAPGAAPQTAVDALKAR